MPVRFNRAAFVAGVLGMSAFGISAQPQTATQATPQDQNATPDGVPETEPVRNIAVWNLPKKGERLAIRGYDPVAYFPEGGAEPRKGNAAITTEHNGVVYRFASESNRDLFLRSPARYEPAFGGWCAWAMRDGEKVEIDPASFIVRDDRLCLFFKGAFADTRAKWLKTDHDASSKLSDTQWNKLSGESPRHTPLKP